MLQYLLLNNHLQSAKAFKQQSSLTWKQILLTSFSKGNREQFFSIFDLLRKEEKLQFYLRVYFLIYSIHPHIISTINNPRVNNASIPQKEINSFRQFLDTKGADLAKTSQFLQFYALPFIKKPLQHGAFKTLFGKSWVGNLREKLVVYMGIQEEKMKAEVKSLLSSSNKEQAKKLQKHSQQHQQPPSSSNNTLFEQKLLKLQLTNKELFEQLQQIKQSYHHLQQTHQQMIQDFNQYMMDSQNKWFQSYKELVKTSRSLLQIVGSLVGDDPKLQRKYIQGKRKVQKYQRFVSRKLQDLLIMSQDISVFDKPSVNEISQYTMKSGYTSKSWVNNNNYSNVHVNVNKSIFNNNNNNNNVLVERNNNNHNNNINGNINLSSNNNYTSGVSDYNIVMSNNQNNLTSYVQIDQFVATNYAKLNGQFVYVGNNSNKTNNKIRPLSQQQKITIIQGFSWRLLKSKSPLIRRQYCISMIDNNFLGLGRVDSKSRNRDLQLCTRYLKIGNNQHNNNQHNNNNNNHINTGKQLTASILQLLNYMKVDYYSRRWLFSQHNIIYPLMQVMAQLLQQLQNRQQQLSTQPNQILSQQQQSYSHHNIIITPNLQSFLICLDIISTISAYKDYRQAIISTELPIFLLNILQSYPKLFQSQQLMQLIMMVLMNVSAFPEGIELLQQYENIFSTLSVAYEYQYRDIIMLVNGFYYTLLGDRRLYDLAIESNMREFVRYLLEQGDQYKQHQRQLRFIQSRLQQFNDNNNNNELNNNNQQQPSQLFLVDSQSEYQQIQIIQDQIDNLQGYIQGYEKLIIAYSFVSGSKQAVEQQKRVQMINQQFVEKTRMRKQQVQQESRQKKQNVNARSGLVKSIPQESKPVQVKRLPVQEQNQQQSQIAKKSVVKNDQIQVSLIDLNVNNKQNKANNKTNSHDNDNDNNYNNIINKKNNNKKIVTNQPKKNQQQSKPQYPTIKQQLLFASPSSNMNEINLQKIPPNSKQAQFMGLLNGKLKNPSFPKQSKTQIHQKYSSPVPTIPLAEHANLPSFGSYTPPVQLGPEQKTRRKQLLKQLNEEIQSKQHQKQKTHQPVSKLVFQQDKVGSIFGQKKNQQLLSKDVESGPKAARGNAHMRKQDQLKQKQPIIEKQVQRKAFQSRPKVHRTPPKDDQ